MKQQKKIAKVLTVVKPRDSTKVIFEPTIFDEVQDNFTIMNQKLFGPLVPIFLKILTKLLREQITMI